MSVKTPTKMTPEEMYKQNQQIIEKNAQQQYETAYVNQELMNKYLKQNLASQGLDNSGIANLYAQQANTNYMNERANIAQAQQEAESDLFNLYYNEKKTEQEKADKAAADLSTKLLGIYGSQIGNSVNNWGYLEEDKANQLRESFNWDDLTDADKALLESQFGAYAATEEQLRNRDEYENRWTYDRNAGDFDELIKGYYDSVGKLTTEDADELFIELENIKDKIGQTNYEKAKENIQNAIETSAEREIRELKESYPKVTTTRGIDASTATKDVFQVPGYGEDKEVDTYVQSILDMAKSGKLKNGDIVNFNHKTNSDDYIYVYYNGKFYKSSYGRGDVNVGVVNGQNQAVQRPQTEQERIKENAKSNWWADMLRNWYK